MPLRLDIAPELRPLLTPRHRRTTPVVVTYDGTSSLGHVITSLGLPLTEVGALTVDGSAAVPRDRPPADAHVEVEPAPRPQPTPTDPPRFLLDVHLGALARRMRLLGLDTAYRNEADDPELVTESVAQQRVLLSQDRGLLRRSAVRDGAYVRGSRPDVQLDDVLDRFRPALAPWTRCLSCNGLLQPVDKGLVLARLEPGTRRSYDEFSQCPECGRVYWRGAHARRLQAVVDRARGV